MAAAQARQSAKDAQAAALVRELRDRLEDLIFAAVPQARPAVPLPALRAPHITSILLPGFPAEPILHALEARSVFASEGAACSSHAREQSRVQRALGIAADTGVLRFSLSRLTTADDVEQAARALALSITAVAKVVHRVVNRGG